jgi:hypothetical protein
MGGYAAPDVVHARPDDHQEGDKGDRRSPVSEVLYAPPQRVSLYFTALCALWNIRPYQTGVPCGSYVPRGRRVRVRDRYPPPSLTGGRSTTY